MTTTVVNRRHESFDVDISRTSKWGNPFIIGRDGSRHEVIERYRHYVMSRPDLMSELHELKGKRLGCWCKPASCHGDVLIALIAERCK